MSIPHSYLQKEFEHMVSRHGTWVVYARANRKFPCTKCNHTSGSGEGDSSCPMCLGTGYRVSLEKQQIIIAKGRRMLPFETDTIPGYFPDSSYRAYFPRDMHPASYDLMLEVEWNTQNVSKALGEPTNLIHVYSITQVEPYMFSGQPACYASALDSFDNHLNGIASAIDSRRR